MSAEDEKNREPWYEADDDYGCNCDGSIESEWEWDPDQECYICTGCGAMQ